jgi:hypothetical protein
MLERIKSSRRMAEFGFSPPTEDAAIRAERILTPGDN